MLLLVPLQQIHSSGISLCGIFSILLKIFWKKEYFLKEKNAKKGKFILKSSQLPTI
jgi:xanthine/uracil permease